MKLFYPIFFFVLISFYVSAQNWSPIVEGDVYHYELVGTTPTHDSVSIYIDGNSVYFYNNNPVAATIRIDSTTTDTSTGTTTSHLNKIVQPCETCPPSSGYSGPRSYLQNQPQFLGSDIVVANDCEYVFTSNNELLIKPCAPVGETWIFENSQNISAEVIAITEGEVFGNTDSLKHIALSNGDTVILSKSHGIIEFPHLDNDTYHRLMGIQTRDLGFKMPGHQDFFDFNVGDILQYEHSVNGASGTFGTTKIRVIGKDEFQDSIVYQFNRTYYLAYYNSSYGMGPDEVYLEYSGQDDYTYTLTKNNVTNFYPNQLFDMTEYCLGESDYNYCGELNFDSQNMKHTLYFGEKQGRRTKLMYSDGYANSPYLDSYFIPQNDSTDTLENGCSFGCHRVWEEGLGETAFLHTWFEGSSIRELTAYIIDGDTTGTITPDEDILISTTDIAYQTPQITLSPNPAVNTIQYDIQTNTDLSNIEIKIYDTIGKTLIQQTGQQSTSIDISNLQNGIYFISFQTSKGLISRKFIKSQ